MTVLPSEDEVATRFGDLISRTREAFGSDASYAAQIVDRARQTADRKRRPRTAA